ncbi:MAG: LL-diaminopimelate aminotransferase, partial [Deltaproteobacteria bacterium]
QIKSNIDSGAFNAIQIAGITALDSSQDCVKKNCEIYQERRDILVRGLNKVGIKVETPRATFYVWCEVPEGYTSAEFASLLLKEAGIVVTPGNGFGDPGEGFIRMALTVDKGRLEEAISRMEKLNF